MKHLVLVIFILSSLTAAQKGKVEQLLNKAQQYYKVSEDVEQLKQFVEDIVADPLKGTQEMLDELEGAGDSTSQSIQFAQVARNTTNQTYVNNTNSTSNYTYPNNTYYNYTTNKRGQNLTNNYSYSNYTYPSNYTNNTTNNQSYPSNYTYSNYTYPASYSYSYDTTNNTNSSTSNSTYPNDTYSNSTYQNYSDTNQTYSNYTDTNSTYSNSTDTNSTYQNSTNYTNSSSKRERLEQSKIHLKFRKQLNLSGVHNFTQNVTYYNPYRQQYEYIVLFNETNTVSRNRPNEYYFYQNNTLITLQREYDYYGNVVYRNLTLDYNLVVQSQSNTYQYGQNANVFGTLVIGNGNVNGTYYNNGFTYYSNSDGSGISQFGNHQQQSNANFTYKNGSAYLNGNSNRNGYDSQYNNTYQYNGTVQLGNEQYDSESYNNYQQIQGNYDQAYNYSSIYTNNSNYNSDYHVNTQGVYSNNFTYEVDSTQSNSSQNSNSKDKYSYNNQTSTYNTNQNQQQYQNQQSNTLWASNYSLGNKTNFNQDYQSSSQNTHREGGDYLDDSSSSNYNVNYNYENSTFASNSTNQYNASDNYINKIQGSSYQYDYQYQDVPYYQASNSEASSAYNQTHQVTVQDNQTQRTDVTQDGGQYNYSSYQYGNEDPTQSATGSNTHINYSQETNVQQFSSLRGSKKTTGSWKQADVQELLSSNSQIVEQAIKAVNEKYNPIIEGFEFNSVASVKEQIVAGFNYAIDLIYTNADGDSRTYQVIIYSAPWTNQPDQVTSCQRVSEQDQ